VTAKGTPNGRCTVCQHAQRGRIDYLLSRGGGLLALAKQFGLRKDALARHNRNHIGAAYRHSVRVGPFESEDRMRDLFADASTSVLENLRAVYGGLLQRWMVALESGADHTLALLTGRLHENLTAQARLTRELQPVPANFNMQVNVFTPEWFSSFTADMQQLCLRHPELRPEVVEMLKSRMAQQPLRIEDQRDADAA
jgi:hypothetical protein